MSEYARQFVSSLAYQLLGHGRGSRRYLIKQLLPYCVVRRRSSMSAGTFLLLNREHKPLGWPPGRAAHLNYLSPEFDSFEVALSPGKLAELHRHDTEHGEFYYLYGRNMGAPPWSDLESAAAYCQRLRMLFDFEIMGADGAA